MVRLIAEALCNHGGSGHAAFDAAHTQGQLPATAQAAYGKLRRMPIAVSEALLNEGAPPLRAAYPQAAHRPLPPCVQGFEVFALDGKAIKRVAKRLKPLRRRSGGVLGGRALVALSLRRGLVEAMAAHPDGDANDVRFTAQVMATLRRDDTASTPKRLWVADRQFCTLCFMDGCAQGHDEFLVRQHQQLGFQLDASRPARSGTDAEGRCWTEQWGWAGSPQDARRRAVRRIRLELSAKDSLVLLTSLLDAEQFPAAELLEVYRGRWGIERVFQQVTEVFGLQGLIGCSALASVFQFAFCLMLYNLLQLLRAYVAAGQRQAVESISVEKLFEDAKKQLIAWGELGDVEQTVALYEQPLSAAAVQARLARTVGVLWKERWRKSPPQKRRRQPPHRGRVMSHVSVYRVMEKYRRTHKKSA